MANYSDIYAALDQVIAGSKAAIPIAVYGDENSVFDADELELTWSHGKNITLGAAMCDYHNAAHGHPAKNPIGTARQIILNYATLTGDGHGEHDARIYASAHARAMLAGVTVARSVNDSELEAAILDWGGSRCGFVGLPLGRRPNLARDRKKYDAQVDPGTIVCDRDWAVEWAGDRYAGAPAVLDAQRIPANAVFGQRSWKEYHEKGDSTYYWTHLEFGGGQGFVRTALDLRPDLRDLVERAGRNDLAALAECWRMAKKRLPKNGHYATARWEGGVAYWMPESAGAVSSSPGGLCLILFDDTRNADPLIFVNGFPGYTHTEGMTQTCRLEGDSFVLRRENGRLLSRRRPAGKLLAWFEYANGRVIREFIDGIDLSGEAAPPPEPQPEPSPAGPADAFDWLVNAGLNGASLGPEWYCTISPVADHPHLFALRKAPGPHPPTELLWRDDERGEIRIVAECGYNDAGELIYSRTFFGQDGRPGVTWLPRRLDREQPTAFRQWGTNILHQILDGGSVYDPNDPPPAPGTWRERSHDVDVEVTHRGVTTELGEPVATLDVQHLMGSRSNPTTRDKELYRIGFGARGAYGYTGWATYPGGIFARRLDAARIGDAGPAVRLFGIDPLDPELRERWFATVGYTGELPAIGEATRRPAPIAPPKPSKPSWIERMGL